MMSPKNDPRFFGRWRCPEAAKVGKQYFEEARQSGTSSFQVGALGRMGFLGAEDGFPEVSKIGQWIP